MKPAVRGFILVLVLFVLVSLLVGSFPQFP